MFQYYLFLVIFAQSTLIYGFNEQRILNGKITPPDLFQFVLRIQPLFCSATIISKRHVLTATHCIDDQESTTKIIFNNYMLYMNNINYAELRPLDTIDSSEMPMSTTVFIPKQYIPKQYNEYYILPHDIAILEFPEGTNFGIAPVKLAKDYFEKEGDEAYIAGFGYWWMEGDLSSGRSNVLRHDKVTMINDCYGTLKICGGNLTHRGLPGDSGGPMLIQRNNQWYQIGVAAQSGDRDYRTRISSYCNFIEEVTKNEVECVSIFSENQNNINQMMPIKQFPSIYKGQETPLNIFDFVIPLYNYNYGIGCTATVISKRHLLTSVFCALPGDNAPATQNFNFISSYGIFFPDLRSKNVKLSFIEPVNVITYFPLNLIRLRKLNLAVIEFPEGTNFGVEPVTLAKDYLPVYLDNDTFIFAGYGKYEFKKNMHTDGTPPTLQHTTSSSQIDPLNDKIVVLENINLMKDEGGPTMIEKNGKFYQIAVNFNYGTFYNGTYNGSRVFVSPECGFIEEVTKNEVKCESAAPILLSSKNNALKIEFQIIYFLLYVFCNFF